MACAEDTLRSSSRISLAARVIQAAPGAAGCRHSNSYQTGEAIPAPYPDAYDSRAYDQGTHDALVFVFGRPRKVASSSRTGGMTASAGV
jgi:hypothetical protein